VPGLRRTVPRTLAKVYLFADPWAIGITESASELYRLPRRRQPLGGDLIVGDCLDGDLIADRAQVPASGSESGLVGAAARKAVRSGRRPRGCSLLPRPCSTRQQVDGTKAR
jgi:hypothetical protein